MLLASCSGIIPPKEWCHDSILANKEGWTVAMFIAEYVGQLPP